MKLCVKSIIKLDTMYLDSPTLQNIFLWYFILSRLSEITNNIV